MRCNYTLGTRFVIIIGAAIILAGLLAQLFGVKTSSSWTESELLDKNEYLAVMLWSLTSKGKAHIDVKGASKILYTVVKGNPLSLVMNSSAFGVKIESTKTSHDFRAGVFYASAKVNMDPVALAFVASRFKLGGKTMFLNLTPSESVIFLVIPSNPKILPVEFSVKYKVSGYKRLSFLDTLGIGITLIIIGLILSCVPKRR
jgi:hypothetical protein